MTGAHDDTTGARFLAAFNAIEDHLRRKVAAGDNATFSKLLEEYTTRFKLRKEQREAIRAFADLRNAISHGRYFNGKPIANPVVEVVREIERTRDLLMNPPTALRVLGRREIYQLDARSQVADALALIKEYDISQFPVYENGILQGILTTNAIARWLAEQFANNCGLAETAHVSEVMRFIERYERVELCKRNVTVQGVLDLLAPSTPAVQPVRAVLITESARKAEQPLGIAVVEDLPKLFASIQIQL